MVFWIGILIAIIFALSAIKLGFYHAWTMLFNVLVAIYLAVRIGPFLEEFLPGSLSGQYSRALALMATGTGTFLILQAISYVLLIGQFEVTFPRAATIATFVFCTTPFCQNQFVKEIGFNAKSFQDDKMQSCLVSVCNLMDKFVASGEGPDSAEKTINEMLIIKQAHNPAADANAAGSLRRPVNANEPNSSMNPAPIRSQSDANETIHP
jgi:hypothetical protein